MKVTHAYCVELGEVVTIDKARRAFLSEEPSPPRYTFLCSDDACRAQKVVVSGVNYTFAAEEFPKRVEAHFRATSPEKHLPSCEWRVAEQIDADIKPIDGETSEQTLERTALRKLTDRITEFDPRDVSNDPGTGTPPITPDAPRLAAPRPDGPRPIDPNRVNPRTRTRDLERLVQTYREARADLPTAELHALHVNVFGLGRVRLIDYFQPIQYCSEHTTNTIINGGALFEKNYGKGFRLRMFDKINTLPVYLYVSAEMMEAYRYRKYVRDIVDKIPSHKYVRVYANGALTLAPSGKSYNLEISHLRHLALVLGPKLDSALNAAP